jgi:hypothetical protein
MKPNPGGQLDPVDVVGRDPLVKNMWEVLEGRSIYMNDLRRIGKTQILNRMEALVPADWLVIKRDLGGFHTAAEFAAAIFKDSHARLGAKGRAFRRMKQLLDLAKGVEISGVLKLPSGASAPWKDVVIKTMSDLQDELANTKKRLVFLWDEVPFLIDNIGRREGAPAAMEVLDLLRAQSQEPSRIRFVLTGSVGLHHVLADLRAGGYIGSPLNHLERIAPGPLSQADARKLAADLLQGAAVSCADFDACATAVAGAAGNVPFYIHKLVSRLPKGPQVDGTSVERTVREEIAHPDNDWDFAHYRSRVPHYYGNDEKAVLAILDTIAAASAPLSLDEVRRGVNAALPFDDREKLLGLLKLLSQDHYLTRDDHGRYAFRLALICRWWRFDRGLEGASS